MKVIGVTGGMASGKSTVAKLIARDRYPHVDADQLVHYLMAHDGEAIAAIGGAFSDAIVDGTVSRGALTALIAQGVEVVPTLERILHPRIREAEERAIALAREQKLAALVLDIPLLFETQADALCDVVIAASAPLALRKQRAFARPGMTDDKWEKLIARQWTEEQRNARADVVVDTSSSMEATQRQISMFLQKHGLM